MNSKQTQCGCGQPTVSQSDAVITHIWNVIQQQFKKPYFYILSILVLIAISSMNRFYETINFTVSAYNHLLPFLIGTVFITAYLQASHADLLIKRFFSGNLYFGIITAALLGALSPFCSCGVIPVIAGLLASGVPLSAVMAFWIASPIMSPDMFVLTAGELGMEFAVVKTISTILLGIMAGLITLIVQKTGLIKSSQILKKSVVACQSSSCGPTSFQFNVWSDKKDRKAFLSGFYKTFREFFKSTKVSLFYTDN